MDESQIKEEMSKCFLKVVGYHQGYNFGEDEHDIGVDCTMKQMGKRDENGKKRYYLTGKAIDIQLKATTENRVTETGTCIKYDLEVKNYNDMMQRINENSPNPLILVLYILPDTKDERVKISSGLTMNKEGYWFIPGGNTMSRNTSTVRIEIPKDNKIELDTIDKLFEQYC